MTNKQPNPRAGEAFDPPCTDCGDTGVTFQAERDKATADLGAIDEIAVLYGWGKPDADIGKKTVAAIAAAYRVETDPLVEALRTIVPIIHCEGDETAAEAVARQLRSDPRWLEIGRSA